MIFLFYPDTVVNEELQARKFEVKDEFSGHEIVIRSVQLPIIDHEIFEKKIELNKPLSQTFETTKENLAEYLKNVFNQY